MSEQDKARELAEEKSGVSIRNIQAALKREINLSKSGCFNQIAVLLVTI